MIAVFGDFGVTLEEVPDVVWFIVTIWWKNAMLIVSGVCRCVFLIRKAEFQGNLFTQEIGPFGATATYDREVAVLCNVLFNYLLNPTLVCIASASDNGQFHSRCPLFPCVAQK